MSLDPGAAERLKETLATAVAVPVIPIGPGGEVDEDAYAALLRRLVSEGITVVTPNGNTGEFYALTAAEARRVTRTAVEAAGGRAEVLAGVGHDVAAAIDAARHAQEAGARMIMIHQPVHPYVSADGWVDYHAAIAGAVPDMGVVLYVRNERIDGGRIAELGARCRNVLGIKYAVRDTARFAAVARDAGIDRFTWIAGLAEMYAPAYWAMGARGFTSGLVNVHPALALAMLDALRGGDFGAAMKVWEAIRPFEELRATDGSADNVSVVKEALAQLGRCGARVRPPGRALPASVRGQITEILRSWGLRPGAETGNTPEASREEAGL
jgi:4-hydroxy-tetrahydrodipicolinate synthase